MKDGRHCGFFPSGVLGFTALHENSIFENRRIGSPKECFDFFFMYISPSPQSGFPPEIVLFSLLGFLASVFPWGNHIIRFLFSFFLCIFGEVGIGVVKFQRGGVLPRFDLRFALFFFAMRGGQVWRHWGVGHGEEST